MNKLSEKELIQLLDVEIPSDSEDDLDIWDDENEEIMVNNDGELDHELLNDIDIANINFQSLKNLLDTNVELLDFQVEPTLLEQIIEPQQSTSHQNVHQKPRKKKKF